MKGRVVGVIFVAEYLFVLRQAKKNYNVTNFQLLVCPRFSFTMDGKVYPARLVDLPCVLETQKTLDRSTFFKSGDVGQMLIVYKVRIACRNPGREGQTSETARKMNIS